MKIGQKLSFARKQKGYTQESLAEETNLSLSTIQRIEKGKVVPRAHTLKTLSDVLGLELFEHKSNVDNIEVDTNELSLVLLFSTALVFVPPFNILYLFRFWKNNRGQKRAEVIGRQLLSFQTISFILLMLFICLIPMLSFILTGQKAYGQINAPFLVYLSYVGINILATSYIYFKIPKEAFKLRTS